MRGRGSSRSSSPTSQGGDHNHHHHHHHILEVSSSSDNNSNNKMSQPDVEFRPFKKWAYWLVPSFVAINVTLFVITMYVNNCPKYSLSCVAGFLGRFSFQPVKENPLIGPSSPALVKMGALEVTRMVSQHQAWRLITSTWLHAGVIHLLANMISLVFIGIRLEQEFGFVKIGLLYIISGFGANVLSALFLEPTISVGASGALFGLLGAMLSELITNWTIYANKLAALLTLILIIMINLGVGILPHVDNFAHLGGFTSGFLLGFILLIRPQFGWVSQKRAPAGRAAESRKPKHKPYQYGLWIAAAVTLSVGIVVGLVLLFKGVNGNDHCSWCHYMSCFPTSKWRCESQRVFCQSTQIGNKLNLTCLNNGRSHIFPLFNENSAKGQRLCAELCI